MIIKNNEDKAELVYQMRQSTLKKGKKEQKTSIENLIHIQIMNQNTIKQQIISVKQVKCILRTLGILKEQKNKSKYFIHQSTINKKILSILTKKYKISEDSIEKIQVSKIIETIIQERPTFRQSYHFPICKPDIDMKQFEENLQNQIQFLEDQCKGIKQKTFLLEQMKNSTEQQKSLRILQLKKIIEMQEEQLESLNKNIDSSPIYSKKPRLQIYIENSEQQM